MPEFEFGEVDGADRIEPGSPSLENVTFVLLGATATLVAVLHLAGVLP